MFVVKGNRTAIIRWGAELKVPGYSAGVARCGSAGHGCSVRPGIGSDADRHGPRQGRTAVLGSLIWRPWLATLSQAYDTAPIRAGASRKGQSEIPRGRQSACPG